MFAAWLVFVHHYPPSTSGLWGPITRQGHVGVTVFFVLSGFLITTRYYLSWVDGRLRLRDYVKKRVARILPLYYAVFISSLLLSGQAFFTPGRRLPEWTMTQGFFWQSLYYAAIPTSWSLTVEECFYALAPLVFLALAALGGYRRLGVSVVALLGLTAAFGWTGLWLVDTSRLRGLTDWYGFFASNRHMAIYTIFGRFFDFAAGIACGLFYLRANGDALWQRRQGKALSWLVGILSAGAFVAALTLMDRAGGIGGDEFARGWKYNGVVALASAAMILALTCPGTLASRALALRPFVYLGRTSFALYLIQMTPLGQGALAGAELSPAWLHVGALYLAMNVVCALLYEMVEKPARHLVLRVADRLGAGVDNAMPCVRRALASVPVTWTSRPAAKVAVMTFVVGVLMAALASASVRSMLHKGGSPSLTEVRATTHGSRLAGPLTLETADPQGFRRLRLPAGWTRGREPDSKLLLFVDGASVPVFLGAVDSTRSSHYAFSRGPRSGSLFVRCAQGGRCAEASVAQWDGVLRASVGVRRVMTSPLVLGMLATVFALWITLGTRAALRHRLVHPWLHLLVAAFFAAGMARTQSLQTALIVALLAGGWLCWVPTARDSR